MNIETRFETILNHVNEGILFALNESLEKELLTGLEQSRDDLSMARVKEKELNELKSRFITMAPHEFRTPLSTIVSTVSLIGKYPLSEEDEKRVPDWG